MVTEGRHHVYFRDEGYLVLAGSTAHLEMSGGAGNSYKALRAELIEKVS